MVDEETVDWMKIEDGQGVVGRLVVAPHPWRPHPPRTWWPVPVGTRWHAARAGPDTFDKRRRNGKQRAAGDLEGPLFWSRVTLPTLSCRRYTHHAAVARYSDYRCSPRIQARSLHPKWIVRRSRRSRAYTLGTWIEELTTENRRSSSETDLHQLIVYQVRATRIVSDYGEWRSLVKIAKSQIVTNRRLWDFRKGRRVSK